MAENKKKPCSQIGLVHADTISQDSIFTGKCKHLGGCKPPIKATSTPNGTRGIPLTGSYNNPGFGLTRAFRKSHAAKYGRAKTTFTKGVLNQNGKLYGGPSGSGSGFAGNILQ